MSLLQQGSFGPEVLSVASEAFSKAWNFIEHDPMLTSYEREQLQAELAHGILEVVQKGESAIGRAIFQWNNGSSARTRRPAM